MLGLTGKIGFRAHKPWFFDILPALKDGDSLITHRTLQPTT